MTMARPEDQEPVIERIREGKHAEEIWLVDCPYCGIPSYWNQGSHASCHKCGANLSDLTDEAYTLADFWDSAPYPCDERELKG
jgi:endogenous inhibitor of DNA gyrase (YacG/DUF329 family)